jgi:hypothetical protein
LGAALSKPSSGLAAPRLNASTLAGVATERKQLIDHLRVQAAHLVSMTSGLSEEASPDALEAVRDHVFTIRETLSTLGVPLATVANIDWNRAIGTDGV